MELRTPYNLHASANKIMTLSIHSGRRGLTLQPKLTKPILTSPGKASTEFIHLCLTEQDWHSECTEHMVYIGLREGG